ncbi:hypothetical protein FB461_1708 [Rarobacter faecitabidus]|uniref:Uncharacterized protein n=2 Tax=Rarobacter faecitabidus TaxID=13243 RepID=A0A542ZNX3_RARFA|nr:hypothetical protein FB461_1708 [Rarobacter faecitabidus]
MVLAAAQLMKRGLEFSVGKNPDRGYVLVGEDESFKLWLDELTKRARALDRAQWPALIATWAEQNAPKA